MQDLKMFNFDNFPIYQKNDLKSIEDIVIQYYNDNIFLLNQLNFIFILILFFLLIFISFYILNSVLERKN